MVSLNFTTGKDKILDGSKQMTIRALRKRPFKVGDSLQLFSGLRTKNCEKLKEETCLYERKLTWGEINCSKYSHGLAILDGFIDYYSMADWFHETHHPLTRDREFQIVCWGEETKGKLERIFSD